MDRDGLDRDLVDVESRQIRCCYTELALSAYLTRVQRHTSERMMKIDAHLLRRRRRRRAKACSFWMARLAYALQVLRARACQYLSLRLGREEDRRGKPQGALPPLTARPPHASRDPRH